MGKIFGFIQLFGPTFAKTSVAEPLARGTLHLRLDNRVFLQANIKTVLGDQFPKSAAFRSSKKLLRVMKRLGML
jgi:hypothetical protein